MATKDPETLQEALNLNKFLKTTHKNKIMKWKEAYHKQTILIKRLEENRKKELEFLSYELRNYENTLATQSQLIAKQIQEKDDIIQKQLEFIEELNIKLKLQAPEHSLPDINILTIDSNSDSGVALEQEDNEIKAEMDNTIKSDPKTKRCSRRFAESINFLRKVDFSSRKCKASRDSTLKRNEVDEIKKNRLEVPFIVCKRVINRQSSDDKAQSDDDRLSFRSRNISPNVSVQKILSSNKANDSMNNYFSDDGSEDTSVSSEDIFDRVMTRSSIRRSVKINPKYKKINRTKAKQLEKAKIDIIV